MQSTHTPTGKSHEAHNARPSRCGPIAILVVHLALVGAVLFSSFGLGLNPSPDKRKQSDPAKCVDVLAKDDLVHLALRTARDQQRQLARWDLCDPTTRRRARDTFPKDDVQIGVIGFALLVAVVRCWRRARWRLAAFVGAALAVLYLVADSTENVLLDRVLARQQASSFLHWAAAIKFGALIGALPVFLVSLCYAVSEVGSPRKWSPPPAAWSAPRDFVRRWKFRTFGTDRRPHAADPDLTTNDTGKRTMGVCCSGGGIRSAAFSLGALQALDDERGGRELPRAKWISAVSGGSYIAAAWVSARKNTHDEPFDEQPWSRRSPEEDHLRRHSSYLAPGIGGKVWALARYLLGLTLNLAVVALAIAALVLPYSWVVSRYEQPKLLGKGNEIALPAGGCLQLPDGRHIAAVPGTALLLASASELELDPNAPVPPSAPAPAATPAPSSTTCPAQPLALPAPGAPGAPPAAKPLRRLDIGTQVELHLRPDKPLPVRGRDIAACPDPNEDQTAAAASTTTVPEWTCIVHDADVFQLGQPVRLVSAPRAVLTLHDDAIVVRPGGNDAPEGGRDAAGAVNASLVRPCGTHPCERSAAPMLLTDITLAVIVVAALAGFALLLVRPRAPTARWVTGVVKLLGAVSFGLIVFVFAFPYLIVAAENGRWWLEDRLRFEIPGAGVLGLVVALVSQIGAFTGSTDKAPSALKSTLGSLASKLRPIIVKLAAWLVGPLLVLLAAVLIGSYGAEHAFGSGQLALWVALAGALACVLSGGDLNEWSLHPFYRDRLRAGFVAADATTEAADYIDHAIPAGKPHLLVCAAANIADDRATPPGRPVASWVFSHNSIGSAALGRVLSLPGSDPVTGFVPPGGFPDSLRQFTSLWETVAVSGAAFSPSMGKMTKPERVLFALGNLRLGVWYPNPGYLADTAAPGQPDLAWYDRHHPRPWYLAKEALGLHRATDPWIYVTDGGHYENLGLIELLRRRCREIYCFDGSGDTTSTFGTLSEAMRLAREELDVEINFDPTHLKADADGVSEFGAWAGTVRYPGEEHPSGWIVVAKLEVPKDAPFDIVDLARTLPKFPSNPTSDQLYTDQKFEAYRALGHYLGMRAKKLGIAIAGAIAGDEPLVPDDGAVAAALTAVLETLVPEPPPADLKLDVVLEEKPDD